MLRTGASWGSKIGITAEGLQPLRKSSSLSELEAAGKNGDRPESTGAGVSKSCIHNRAARTTTRHQRRIRELAMLCECRDAGPREPLLDGLCDEPAAQHCPDAGDRLLLRAFHQCADPL